MSQWLLPYLCTKCFVNADNAVVQHLLKELGYR